MYFMADFCRVCLHGEKGLKDVMKDKEAPDSLYSKLKICVSEVDWCLNKTMLMCEGCILKLNTAFEFKCQCIKATEMLKNFLNHLIIDDQKTDSKLSGSVVKNEINVATSEESSKLPKDKTEVKQASFVCVRPDQQLFTPGQLQNVIVSSNATQSAFPNLFLNLIPTNLLKSPTNPPALSSVTRPPVTKTVSQLKDTNQNMFVSINNTLHRLYPVIPSAKDNTIVQSPTNHTVIPPKLDTIKPVVKARDVSQLLVESKTEELSVEIDPSCFDLEEDSPTSINKADMTILKDWEDVILCNKITTSENHDNTKSKMSLNSSLPTLNKMLEVNNDLASNDFRNLQMGSNAGGVQNLSNQLAPKQQLPFLGGYVPAGPKLPENLTDMDFEEKIEFFNAGHFMTQIECEKSAVDNMKVFSCEMCSKTFEFLALLNSHIKQNHSGKFPYTCKYCFTEFALRSQFKEHLHTHLTDSHNNYTKDSITLEDLNSEHLESLVLSCVNYKPAITPKTEQPEADGEGESGEYKCELCPRSFNSGHGLSRHKVRKHNFKAKKKYFIKGMKNARCDICNREFSTQSYLQLHIKLHYRKSDFRRKVFRKESYPIDGQYENINSDNNSHYDEYNVIDNHMLDVDIHMDTDDSFAFEATIKDSLTTDTTLESDYSPQACNSNVSFVDSVVNTAIETSSMDTQTEKGLIADPSFTNKDVNRSSKETIDSCSENSSKNGMKEEEEKPSNRTPLSPSPQKDSRINDNGRNGNKKKIPVKSQKKGTIARNKVKEELLENKIDCKEKDRCTEMNDIKNDRNGEIMKQNLKSTLEDVANTDEDTCINKNSDEKTCPLMEVSSNEGEELKKLISEASVIEDSKSSQKFDPKAPKNPGLTDKSRKKPVVNDDVTLSNVGIKLKINLRNIKQGSSSTKEGNVEKNKENKDAIKNNEASVTEKLKCKDEIKEQPQQIAGKLEEIVVEQKVEKVNNSRKTLSRKRKGCSSRKTTKKKLKNSKKNERKQAENAESLIEEETTAVVKEEADATVEENRDVAAVDKETIAAAVDKETIAAAVEKETVAASVEKETKAAVAVEEVNQSANLDISEQTASTDNCSTEDSALNDTENETHTYFSGYKIEIVDGKPKCNFCNKLFSRKHDLKRHMNNIHLKAIKYKCHLCDVTFYEAFHLTRHLRQHNCFLICIVCTKNFSAMRDLKSHVESVHKDNTSVQCGTCGIGYTTFEDLKEHIQQHDKEVMYRCHLCGEEFGESRDLTKHLVGHSGMYSCTTCQATFATEHELNLHLKVHTLSVTDDTKYECDVCHNKYKKKRYLANHIKHSKHFNFPNKNANELHVNRVERNNSDDST